MPFVGLKSMSPARFQDISKYTSHKLLHQIRRVVFLYQVTSSNIIRLIDLVVYFIPILTAYYIYLCRHRADTIQTGEAEGASKLETSSKTLIQTETCNGDIIIG